MEMTYIPLVVKQQRVGRSSADDCLRTKKLFKTLNMLPVSPVFCDGGSLFLGLWPCRVSDDHRYNTLVSGMLILSFFWYRTASHRLEFFGGL